MSSTANFGRADVLSALADGIIPADERDGGAAAAGAWTRLLAKVDAPAYAEGLECAERLARGKFGNSCGQLSSSQVTELLSTLRDEAPMFFRQLRADVAAA